MGKWVTEISVGRPKVFIPADLAADEKRKTWMDVSKPGDTWATFMTLEGETISCADYYKEACAAAGLTP